MELEEARFNTSIGDVVQEVNNQEPAVQVLVGDVLPLAVTAGTW